MVLWPRNLIPACREWKDSSLPKNLVSYFNILSIIVILLQKYKYFFEMDTTSIIRFRNYDTFLCIFNYKIDAEIANLHQFMLRSSYPIAHSFSFTSATRLNW